jgi:hypothetical protein
MLLMPIKTQIHFGTRLQIKQQLYLRRTLVRLANNWAPAGSLR